MEQPTQVNNINKLLENLNIKNVYDSIDFNDYSNVPSINPIDLIQSCKTDDAQINIYKCINVYYYKYILSKMYGEKLDNKKHGSNYFDIDDLAKIKDTVSKLFKKDGKNIYYDTYFNYNSDTIKVIPLYFLIYNMIMEYYKFSVNKYVLKSPKNTDNEEIKAKFNNIIDKVITGTSTASAAAPAPPAPPPVAPVVATPPPTEASATLAATPAAPAATPAAAPAATPAAAPAAPAGYVRARAKAVETIKAVEELIKLNATGKTEEEARQAAEEARQAAEEARQAAEEAGTETDTKEELIKAAAYAEAAIFGYEAQLASMEAKRLYLEYVTREDGTKKGINPKLLHMENKNAKEAVEKALTAARKAGKAENADEAEEAKKEAEEAKKEAEAAKDAIIQELNKAGNIDEAALTGTEPGTNTPAATAAAPAGTNTAGGGYGKKSTSSQDKNTKPKRRSKMKKIYKN